MTFLGRFDVRFYLVAILFIIFDLEIAFLFPWAVSFGDIGMLGFWSMMVFLAVLTIGFCLRVEEGSSGMGVKQPESSQKTREHLCSTVIFLCRMSIRLCKSGGFLLSSVDSLVNWARTGSLWPRLLVLHVVRSK